jgi:hypothetical protein
MTTTETIDAKLIALLNLLLGSWFLLECNDELIETNVYRHGLKQKLKQLEPELKKIIDKDLNLLWGVDDEAMYGLQEGIKTLFTELSTVRPEQLVGLGELIKRFKQMPDWCMNMLGIQIKESQKIAA